MKQLFFLFAALSVLSAFPLPAQPAGDGTTTIILTTEGGANNSGPTYHAPAFVPIQTSYTPSFSSVLAYYLCDLGLVCVKIENLTTGDFFQSNVNALAGLMVFPISGASGLWTITFTLPNGIVYIGHFDLS